MVLYSKALKLSPLNLTLPLLSLTPLRALLFEKGSLYMLLIAAIYSVTATLGKRAIAASSPLFFATLLMLAGVLLIVLGG